uniref:NIF family HAD-type phosphatase n=1 Tax=Gemmiger formicilis TaxID=745368 RepID=UPI003CCB27F3
MQYKTILFDLDGTLTDSAPGILNSVRYGCRRIGIPVPDEATLRRFLGPPLIDSFHNLCGLNDADTDRAVVLATSKPEEYARRIMEHFDLAQYFTAICGATLDETRTDKAEVIAYALDTIGLTDKTGVVMVGDREHDVIGAKKNALPCIGALYG